MWTDKHQEILEGLIDCLVEPPILAFPDFSQPFVLHTDASNQGLGAILIIIIIIIHYIYIALFCFF